MIALPLARAYRCGGRAIQRCGKRRQGPDGVARVATAPRFADGQPGRQRVAQECSLPPAFGPSGEEAEIAVDSRQLVAD
jgi:hypothetical protein